MPDGHLIRFGLDGFENPFPMVSGKASEQVDEVLRAQKIPQAPLAVHDLATEAISTAVAIGNFIHAERGGRSQPKSVGETLQKLEAQLRILSAQLRERLRTRESYRCSACWNRCTGFTPVPITLLT